MYKRALIIITVLTAFLMLFALTAYATEDAELCAAIFKGEGTEENPYLLSSPSDFSKLAALVNTGNQAYNSAYYKLSGSIDFSGVSSYIPVGKVITELQIKTSNDGTPQTDKYGNYVYEEIEAEERPFMGYLDGDGYAIRNLTINSSEKVVGIFGIGKNAVVENLRVENITVNAERDYSIMAGALFGRYEGNKNKENVRIANCHIDGKINAKSNFKKVTAGGITGYHDVKHLTSHITNCRVDVDINALTNSSVLAGGLVGDVYTGANIEKCVITGSVRAETTGDANANAGAIAARFFFDAWFGRSASLASDEELWYSKAYNIVNSVKLESLGPHDKNISNTFTRTEEAIIGNCFYDSRYKVTPTLNAHIGIEKTEEALFDKAFLENTIGLDFENTWTMVLGRPELISREPYIAYRVNESDIDVQPVGCGSCRVIAAFYLGKRLVTAKPAMYNEGDELSFNCENSEYDSVKLFAFGDGIRPLCTNKFFSKQAN